MFHSELKTFHDAIKPLIYYNWLAGVGTFHMPNRRTCTRIFMKLWTVYVIFSNWISTYITLNALSQVVAPDNTSPMAVNMREVLAYANCSVTLIAPLLVWFQKKRLTDYMRRMTILGNTFQAVLGTPNEYRKCYFRLIRHIVAISSVMFSVAACETVLDQQIRQHIGMQSASTYYRVARTLQQPIAVMLTLDLNFCTFVGYLGKTFRDLNDGLLKLTGNSSVSCQGERLFTISQNAVMMIPGNNITSNSETGNLMNDKHYLLREIRKAHLELCKLSQMINRAFGIQNLISTGIAFVMITGLLYTIYSVFTWKDFNESMFKELISAAVWTSIYVFKIWIVNHACWRVSNEAEETGEVIYEFLNSRVDKELRIEIQEFGVQMLQNPVRFSACGFFTLDYTCVQGVIGAITTYLVILIQMNPASESPTSNTAIPWNRTGISVN